MLVKWNRRNVWSIGSGKGDSSVIQIKPGTNDLKKEEWECIKDHPVVKARLETDIIDEKRGKVKMLEIIGTKKVEDKKNENDDDNGEDENISLGDVSVGEAKTIILETFSTELLREWQESETRKGVLTAIEKQFEAIEESRKEDNGDS